MLLTTFYSLLDVLFGVKGDTLLLRVSCLLLLSAFFSWLEEDFCWALCVTEAKLAVEDATYFGLNRAISLGFAQSAAFGVRLERPVLCWSARAALALTTLTKSEPELTVLFR